MDNSPEESTAAEVAQGSDPRPPVRRRLVQSTLFPHRSPDNAAAGKEDEDCDREADGEEEEYCGSQGKRKRKRKPRASKKAAVNSKEMLSRGVDDKYSPAIAKSNFFLKASEGFHYQKEQQHGSSPEENHKSCSPSETIANMRSPRQLKHRVNSTPKKKLMHTTPKKIVMKSGIKETCTDQISDNLLQSGNATPLVPNLRLEEKMKAEENARIFGEREIHPFFSSCKMAKKNQKKIDTESNWCSVKNNDKSGTFRPIHVFEKVQDDPGSLDWGNWILSERSFISTNCDLKNMCSPVFEGSISSLNFDNFSKLYPSVTSLLLGDDAIQHEFSLDQSLQQEHSHAILPTLSAGEPMAHNEFLTDVEVNWQDHEIGKANFLSGKACLETNSDVEWEDKFLQERMMTYYHGCGNHPKNSLWTNKYLPEKAIEVCGNEESVNFINEWLRLWNERGFQSRKDSTVGKKFIAQDDGYYCYQSESDSENMDEENGLKNVLLVMGPVGSGKSAAIYACAKEQGFQVIEVNASDWRTRALVMQRFGDGVDSYWVQRTSESTAGSVSRCTPQSFPVTSNIMAVQGPDSEVIELIPLSDEEDSQNATGTHVKFVCKDNTTSKYQSESKPLMLFEDVDAILSESQSLIATIQKLAETAKRPIILTSNSCNPFLPNNLDRHELCFTKPSVKEFLCHAHKVCAAEKAKIQPSLVERFIRCCQGDIRKTIMNLQFWCQGQRSRKDSKEQRNYGPLLYDLDASHWMLPKIIPWGYPSELSIVVEKEIAKSLSMMEESTKLMDVVKEGELNKNEMQRHSKRHKSETDGIEAKKEAILTRHCPAQDENEYYTHFSTAFEFSNSSGSPIAFTRRNVRRKLDTILSSDSGNDANNDGFPLLVPKVSEDANNDAFLEVDSKSPFNCLATETCFALVSEQLLNSKGEKLEESFNPLSEQFLSPKGEGLQKSFSHCPETAIYTQINGTQKSVDISHVPESSFVPETQIDDESSLFCGRPSVHHVTDTEAVSSDLIQYVQPVERNNHNQTVSELHKVSESVENFDICAESAHGEEVGDSHSERREAVPRGYQVMDECSRMDFSKVAQSKNKPRPRVLMDSVQETWRRIRGSHIDLRQFVTPEQKDASRVVTLAYGMSNLISEADILLGACQPLICDSLEPSKASHEKSHSFSWYDDQLWMASTIVQHGICFYAKAIAAVGSKHSSVNTMNLSWEMLSSSTSAMALGKLVGQDRIIESSEMGSLKSVIPIKSELDSRLCSIVQTIVPSRSYLATKGYAFHEYISSLGLISISESSRLSGSNEKMKQKRTRVAQNYLSSGALMLSPNDISLLGQCNSYGKALSQLRDASLR